MQRISRPDALPRALLHKRQRITVDLTPSEFHELIVALEAKARRELAAGHDGFADHLLERIAMLREAAR